MSYRLQSSKHQREVSVADRERAFDVEGTVGDCNMSGTTKASSLAELIAHASERFGIRLGEVHEIRIESSTVKIKIIPSGASGSEPT